MGIFIRGPNEKEKKQLVPLAIIFSFDRDDDRNDWL
jgi:hypothetical protein